MHCFGVNFRCFATSDLSRQQVCVYRPQRDYSRMSIPQYYEKKPVGFQNNQPEHCYPVVRSQDQTLKYATCLVRHQELGLTDLTSPQLIGFIKTKLEVGE